MEIQGRSASGSKDHVVVFPFMAKGHIIPLLHLSAALSDRGVVVTFVTTPGNSAFVSEALLPDPNVHLLHIPFPTVPSLPAGCESTDHLPSQELHPVFLHATKLLRDPFHDALRRMAVSGSLPLCVVSDFFLGWTLDVCRDFGVPRLVSHGMGAFAMALCKGIVVNQTHITAAAAGEDTFHVPGMPERLRLTAADVPDTVRAVDPADPVSQFVMEIGEADAHSWGVLVNSFQELERDYVDPFEAFLLSPGARAWLVGPLCLYRRRVSAPDSGDREGSDPCLWWLDAKPPRSVVYISFGTQADVSEEQLDEVALGLDLSGYDFLLVVRSPSWSPPEGTCRRGLIVRGWAPQAEALEHPATGGFLSHCGWNSVLEGLSAGVPILAWPMIAEQPLNAKYVVEELGAGLRVREPAKTAAEGTGGLVGRMEICEGVKKIMGGGGEKGMKARERAVELAKAARAAVVAGGSSQHCLGQLVEELRRVSKANTTINGRNVAVNATV
ncbi:hypothetical protein Taro_029204 [Colocasia esculenta]|uniref:Glycosyltransferase n=1 Tax=Colocasia esculenta TaxID=4460 RepID=A0A843VU60_COLES|nr:hypothetical protein [Colocasia esculenta]